MTDTTMRSLLEIYRAELNDRDSIVCSATDRGGWTWIGGVRCGSPVPAKFLAQFTNDETENGDD